MAKEKLTLLGNDFKELKKIKEKKVDPRLIKKWEKINYKELSQKEIDKHKEKILSKMTTEEKVNFEQKNLLRKKAKNQYEIQAKKLKELKNISKITTKDKKIKKLSEKLISKEFLGKLLSKRPKKTEEEKRTIGIIADKNNLIKKIPENKKIKNPEKKPEGKSEIINKILKLKEELLIIGKNLEESKDMSKHLLEKFFDDTELVEYANENLKKIDQIEELIKKYSTLSN